MLALWVLRDEARLHQAGIASAAAGAVGAVALARAAGAWPALPGLATLAGHWPVLLAGATGLGLLLAAGRREGQARGRPGAAAMLVAAALVAVGAIGQQRWPAVVPGDLGGLIGLAALGGAVGLALLLAHLPVHMRLRPLAVWRAGRALADDSGRPGPDEIEPLAARALALWPRVELLDPPPEVRRALSAGIARLLVAARRWRQLAPPGAVPTASALDAERQALARQQDGSQDPVARARYAEAQRSLALQGQHLEAIAAGRARLRAQLHRQLEALEALHLASVTARTADADRAGDALRPLLAELGRLGDELEAARELGAEAGLESTLVK